MNNKLTIGIFAAASPLINNSDFSYLKAKGFNIVEGKCLRKFTGHTAGTVQERVRDLHQMVRNTNIDILMSYWGGSNTNQLLPYLDYGLFKKYPKPIVGFSDTSALLLAINKLSGIKTYLGPAGITFDKPRPFEYSYQYFKDLIIEKNLPITIQDSVNYSDDLYFLSSQPDKRVIKKNSGRKIYKHGRATGKIIAANLQTLLVLAGTKYFPSLKNKILFLEEEENTNTEMVHRFLTHLSQVVDLNSLKGICMGRFMSQTGFSNEDSQEMVYKDVFKNLNIPIIYNLDFGHSDPLFTIPIGGTVEIDTYKNLLQFI